MYSPEMREYLKEIKRYLVWRYGATALRTATKKNSPRELRELQG